MRKILALLALLGMSGVAYGQACTTTLSVGANVASAVSSAANGATICLNTGNYGTVNLFDIGRSGFVTVRSTTGIGARISPQPGNSDFIRFSSLTLFDVSVNSCSTNIEFLNSTFEPNNGGLLFDASACPSSTHNYLVDGVIFHQVGMALYEGRLNCRDCNAITVRNSTFSGIGSEASDGIQTQGNTRNFTIGPGNVFSGILESLCGATHCDAVQFQGGGTTLVRQNYFEDGDTFIMSPDGCSNVTVENNVFDGSGNGNDFNLQFGSCSNLIFRHNTLYDSSIAVDSKVGQPASSNALVENNIMTGSTSVKLIGGNGCTGCTVRFTLCDAGGCTGTNTVIGTPTYVGGGTNPATWAGWQLTGASLGKSAGNDGTDLGTTYYGTPATALPNPPTNIILTWLVRRWIYGG